MALELGGMLPPLLLLEDIDLNLAFRIVGPIKNGQQQQL
jgi:hypothetical protein